MNTRHRIKDNEESSSGLKWRHLITALVIILIIILVYICYQYGNYENERNNGQKQCPNDWSPSYFELLEFLKPGDLLEFRRQHYQHWGVYTRDSKVVHLNNNGFITMNKIEEVAGTNPCRVNLLEAEAKKRGLVRRGTGKEIASYAEKFVGLKLDYCVINYNCEHFVTDVLYEKPFSTQEDILNRNKTRQIFAKAGSYLKNFE